MTPLGNLACSKPLLARCARGLVVVATLITTMSGVAASRADARSVAFLGVDISNYKEDIEPTTEAEKGRAAKLTELFTTLVREKTPLAIVPVPDAVQARIDAGQPMGKCGACERDYGRELNADVVAWASVEKVSNLIFYMNVFMTETSTGNVLFYRNVNFRNNTDESWLSAMRFIVENYLVPAVTAEAPTGPKTKLALFDFELDDFTAGGPIAGESPAETRRLELVTEKARRILAGTGRYEIIDPHQSGKEAVRTHWLRNCNGCEADICRELGAEQSFLAFFRKISVLDQYLEFQIRDCRTGEMVRRMQTEIRNGTDDTWVRAMEWLIQNRLLPGQAS